MTVVDIAELFGSPFATAYTDGPVTQIEHALQCAWMAEQDNASRDLVAAGLLHDLGHVLSRLYPLDAVLADHHQLGVLPFLGAFPAEVTEPIRLHVDAKRYLCRNIYVESLSIDSTRSLKLQGGPLDDLAAKAFALEPYSGPALSLRLWDDRAKVPRLTTPPLEHFLSIVESTRIKIGAATPV